MIFIVCDCWGLYLLAEIWVHSLCVSDDLCSAVCFLILSGLDDLFVCYLVLLVGILGALACGLDCLYLLI